MNEAFVREFASKAEAVSAELERLVFMPENPHNRIYEAMRYSLLGGGKRLRGVLALACCELGGGDIASAMPFACAIEMLHTYSLIHDDLPAMDNDVLRRGKPTSHIRFDEATAVLAGDALLNSAFELVLGAYKGSDTALAWRALEVLAHASGAEGMIAGQVVDMQWERESIGIEQLEYMHSRKTGMLIVASACVGAIMGQMAECDIIAVEGYAAKLGYAFQIKDDILDIEGESDKLGKPLCSDIRNGKSTFVSVLGMNAAKRKLWELTAQAKGELERFGARADFLCGLAEFTANREK